MPTRRLAHARTVARNAHSRLRLSAAPLRRNPAASGPTGGRRRAFPATPVRLPAVHLRSLMMMSLTAAAVPEAHRWPSALRPSAAPDHRVPARSAPGRRRMSGRFRKALVQIQAVQVLRLLEDFRLRGRLIPRNTRSPDSPCDTLSEDRTRSRRTAAPEAPLTPLTP